MDEKNERSAGESGFFENRELSWLKFNERVLEEAEDARNPLGERLNFLSIFQSNLDEFYMVRVGTLIDTLKDGVTDDKMGLTSAQQIKSVLDRTGELFERRDASFRDLFVSLHDYGVELVRFVSLQDKARAYLEKYFLSDVLPVLSPQIIQRKQPFPFLKNKTIYAVAKLISKSGQMSLGVVPCGDGGLRRLVPLPGEGLRFVLMEDLIRHFLPRVFERYRVEGSVLIRLVRNADIDVDETGNEADFKSAEDYRKTMEKLVRSRTRREPVRLDYNGRLDDELRSVFRKYLGLSKKHLFATSTPLDLSFMSFLRDVLRDKTELFYPRRVPQNSVNIDAHKPIAPQVREHDVLLSYPYESIRPFQHLLNEAGQDPEVVSIKMTLYRVAHNSKIVEALCEAAENGKEVVVLVELRARFDEENNIGWSRVLEQAGCRVIYGLDRMKVHSKLLLITRRHEGEIEYITQIGTGNYNEDTVRLYTDYALMTANREIGAEAARVFNCLSMGEVIEDTKYLLVAPACLRSRILEMIDGQIERARAGREAYLGFKLNGLTDKGLIEKLVEASRAGVKIDLLVRGICCLESGIPGVTDNISVYSIVGRFLEHARVYIIGTGEERRVYISYADFMTRNTQRRVEVAAPILDGAIRAHIVRMFEVQLSDNVKLRRQGPDGSYGYVEQGTEELCSQELFYEEAYAGAWKLSGGEAEPEGEPAVETPQEPETSTAEPGPAPAEREQVPPEPEAEPRPEEAPIRPAVYKTGKGSITLELPAGKRTTRQKKDDPPALHKILARIRRKR